MEQDHAIASAAGQAPSESDLGPGALVDGRYRLASVAARNPNDVVFNALDERSRVRVRVRVTAFGSDPALCRLDHPAIPRVVDSGRTGRWHFVALEWFDGEPVELPATGVTNDGARLRVWATTAMDLLDALEHLHQNAGRAHGDLGLHSLWEGRDGRLRIIDASAPDGPLIPEAVPYASPERLRGLPRDPPSDVYSLAAILYALAYGTPPFGTDSVHARSGHLLRLPTEAPPGVAPLPPSFLAAVRTALDKNPSHRFGTASKMRAVLDDAIRDLDDPSNRTTESKVAVRVQLHNDVETETLKVRRNRPPTFPPTPPPAPVREPEGADAEASDFGTLETTPTRITENPLAFEDEDAPRGSSGAVVMMFAAGVLAIGGLALAATAVLGGVAFWAALPENQSQVSLPPIAAPIAAPVAAPVAAPAPVEPVEAPAPAEAPALPPLAAVVPVWFSSNGAKAHPAEGFDAFVDRLKSEDRAVRLTGYTDSRGPAAANERIGRIRADSVRSLLVAGGVAADLLEVDSKGEADPIADNRTPAGRAANRRVTATAPVAPTGD